MHGLTVSGKKSPPKRAKTGEGSDDPVTGGTIHWYWMDLNMDNGDKLSLWCVEIAKITRAWATVLHADGTNKVVDVTPFTQFKAKKMVQSGFRTELSN